MFYKLLLKALEKHFKKLSPEEKQKVRKMANNETISDTKEKPKVKKRRTKTMADEKEVKKEEVETSKVETENNEVDKEQSTTVTEEEKKVDEPKNETEPVAEDEEPTEPQVNETEPQGNGIRVNDLVTKDMLAEMLAAFEAKFNSVVKENEDLKNKLSAKSEELDGMKDKYENKDFGNFQKQGMQVKDKQANSSFDEYSKQFM